MSDSQESTFPHAQPEVRGDDVTPGTILAGRYLIVGRLGQGAMGTVYEAEDRLLGEHLALKLVRAAVGGEEAAARFRREAQLARRVSHENVCRLHDVELDRSGPTPFVFLTMELVRGETLAARLARGRMTVDEASPIVMQLIDALDAAHRAGVIHRDFKPSNVMLEPDDKGGVRAVITDFGIARPVLPHEAASITGTGDIIGTPAYMAPEQAEGRAITPTADLYALGATMYEMICGRLPFDGEPLAMAIRRSKEDAPSPRVHVPDLDGRWETAIMRCLERDPAKRVARAADVAAIFTGRHTRRWPWAVGMAGVGIAAAAVALILRTSAAGHGATPDATPRPTSVGEEEVSEPPGPILTAQRQITDASGCEEYPSLSPNGRTVVYDVAVSGQYQLVARDLASGAVRQLTGDPGIHYGAAISPDGRSVAHLFDLPKGRSELRVVAMGDPNAPSQVVGEVTGLPSWMDDTHILVGDGPEVVVWQYRDGAWGREVIARIPDVTVRAVARTPGGRTFALWRSGEGDTLILGEIDAQGAARVVDPHVLVARSGWDHYATLLATDTTLFYTRDRTGGGRELVRRRIADDHVEVVVPAHAHVAFSRVGGTLAYSTCGRLSRVMRVPASGEATPILPAAYTNDRRVERLDERHLLLSTGRGDADHVVAVDLANREQEVLTDPGTGDAAASPDGKLLVYADERQHGLFLKERSGGTPRRLTSGPTDQAPGFTHTGQHVVFNRIDPDGGRLYRVALDGSDLLPITDPGTYSPVVSPRIDLLSFQKNTDKGRMIFGLVTGGRPLPMVLMEEGAAAQGMDYSPDGERFLFVASYTRLAELTLQGQKDRYVSPQVITSATYAPDGDGFVVIEEEWDGDLWLAEGDFD